MSVSLQNKEGRHVQPQQGPKLIPQPPSRHRTCRGEKGKEKKKKKLTALQVSLKYKYVVLVFCLFVFYLPSPPSGHFKLDLALTGLCNICAAPQSPNICSPHEHQRVHVTEEVKGDNTSPSGRP